MQRFEYKAVPAPTKGVKAKGRKTPEGRFANAVETVLNAEAADGWEYLRADTLPHEERQGLTGTATTFRTLLMFRRPLGDGGSVARSAHAVDDRPEPVTPPISKAQPAARDGAAALVLRTPAPSTEPMAIDADPPLRR